MRVVERVVVSRPSQSAVEETQPLLAFDDVSKDYGSVRALESVSFSIAPGEIVGLLGPNGAGKTTAISLMLGLRRPTRGQVRLFDVDPRDRHARVRCGAMLQQSSLPGSLTVREIVNLFRSYYRHPITAAAAIDLALLNDKADVLFYKLSGGERQRVYFAVAVCGGPELLFLDEPSVGMDVEMRRAFWSGIKTFAHDGGTVVLTTHYLEEVQALASRVLILNHGRMILDSTPWEVTRRVPSKRVTFRPLTPFSRLSLAGLPVQGLQAEAERVSFVSSEPEEILGQLYLRGCRFRELEVTGASLEEAFLELTSVSRGSTHG